MRITIWVAEEVGESNEIPREPDRMCLCGGFFCLCQVG